MCINHTNRQIKPNIKPLLQCMGNDRSTNGISFFLAVLTAIFQVNLG